VLTGRTGKCFNLTMDVVIFSLPVVVVLLGLAGIALMSHGANAERDRKLTMIDRRLRLIMEHLDIREPASDLHPVLQELVEGRKIHAVKKYREITGAGLQEAKEAVEEIARQRGVA
jgi:ribosomal protein L7/L12